MAARARVQYHEAGTRGAEILIDAEGVAGRRIDPDYVWADIELADARELAEPLRFESEGLCFVEAPSCLESGGDFEQLRPRYEAELCALLEAQIGARESIVFDHTLRSEVGQGRPPSYHAHCDYNVQSAAKRLRELVDESRAEQWLAGDFAIVNVWRPLGSPVERAPIAFVRPQSMATRDWVKVDIVFPARRGQIMGVARSPAHEWVYLSAMRPNEAALFTVYASRGVTGVAHAAVALEGSEGARPRRSIESRVFVALPAAPLAG